MIKLAMYMAFYNLSRSVLTLLRDVPKSKEHRKSEIFPEESIFSHIRPIRLYRYGETFALSILKGKEQRHFIF